MNIREKIAENGLESGFPGNSESSFSSHCPHGKKLYCPGNIRDDIATELTSNAGLTINIAMLYADLTRYFAKMKSYLYIIIILV